MINQNLHQKFSQNNITISEFFANAFLRTGFMIFMASILGVIGRNIAPLILVNYSVIFILLIGQLITVTALNYLIDRALLRQDILSLGRLSYINVGILGFMTGIFTCLYNQSLIGQALFITCCVFFISASYGYYTKKDMSSLSTVLSILLLVYLGLSVVGLIGFFFNLSWVSWLFSIKAFLSIIFNIIFIIFFINENKKIYHQYNHNQSQLQLMNIYSSYVFFGRILDLFINILYLIGQDNKKNK